MTTAPCRSCTEKPTGTVGHVDLSLYVMGPYPGQSIFKCGECGERWIRHYGSAAEKFAWTRYREQFTVRTPRADPVSMRAAP